MNINRQLKLISKKGVEVDKASTPSLVAFGQEHTGLAHSLYISCSSPEEIVCKIKQSASLDNAPPTLTKDPEAD